MIITGEMKSKVDRLWTTFWNNGISNPLSVIKQIYYFDKPLATGLFNYDKISQFNLAIGSGAVESLILFSLLTETQ